jgi:hypothetical protein
MELSSSLEDNCSAIQEIIIILWNLKVHYHVHSQEPSQWSLSCARYIPSTHFHPISLRSILILLFYLHLGLSGFSSGLVFFSVYLMPSILL